MKQQLFHAHDPAGVLVFLCIMESWEEVKERLEADFHFLCGRARSGIKKAKCPSERWHLKKFSPNEIACGSVSVWPSTAWNNLG